MVVESSNLVEIVFTPIKTFWEKAEHKISVFGALFILKLKITLENILQNNYLIINY